MRRVPRSPIDQARTDQAHTDQAVRRRRLPAKWLAAALITAAVASRTFTLKRGWYWWGFEYTRPTRTCPRCA